jgi:hypothetical protein
MSSVIDRMKTRRAKRFIKSARSAHEVISCVRQILEKDGADPSRPTNNTRSVQKNTPCEFKIDKGVPIPSRKMGGNGGGRPPFYPCQSMDVGDSFFLPNKKVFSYVSHNRKFETRKIEENGIKGLRVWRVK